MKTEKRFNIKDIHICSFERTETGEFKLDLNKYPSRLCVVDEEREIAIDVETMHKYPYIRTVSMLYLLNAAQAKKIKEGQRAACVEYMNLPYRYSSSEMLMKCGEIIEKLKQGFDFLDGNKELNNDEYLEMVLLQKEHFTQEIINKNKETQKTMKKCKKRK